MPSWGTITRRLLPTSTSSPNSRSAIWHLRRPSRALSKIILEVAERRRKEQSTASDFLGVVIHARDRKNAQFMPDRRLVNEILTMIVAGHETTASTLNWTWFLISQHPEVEERLSNEAGNLSGFPAIEDLAKFPDSRQIIDESMRLYPDGWLLTRKVLRDDRLGEYPRSRRSGSLCVALFHSPQSQSVGGCFAPDQF